MRKNKPSRMLFTLFCILLTTAFFVESGFAQNNEERTQPYSFSYMQVKPGMDVEFEDFVKSKIPFLKQIGLTDLTVFKTSNFGTSGKYLFITPLQGPETADAELAADRSAMPVEVVSVLSALSRMVVSSNEFMLVPQDDINVPPPEDYVFKVVVCLTTGTVPGSDEEFKKEYKKIVNAMAKGNAKGVLVGKVVLGGNMDEYITFGLFDSFKEIAAGSEKIQKEVASINTKSLMKMVKYRKSEVFVRMPELCIQPESN